MIESTGNKMTIEQRQDLAVAKIIDDLKAIRNLLYILSREQAAGELEWVIESIFRGE